jgi:hypothetical protein
MKILLAGLALLVATIAAPAFAKGGKDKKASSAPAVDPNTAVSKAHGGKVWILNSAPPSGEGADLAKWLSSHPAAAEVAKKPTEERWPITYFAVFKKPPAKGPVTIEFVDKKEPGTLVAQESSQAPAAGLVFQEPFDLETNSGFNKGHTYIVKVGQIINKKFVTYATGEVSLK